MRPALLLALLPALAAAQDVPSLGRPNPALPISESVAVLAARLGKPGGPFAAAQLVLRGAPGVAALAAANGLPDPLARLDAAYGLGLSDRPDALRALGQALSDRDLRVADEARHGFLLLGTRGVGALIEAARQGSDAAGDAAVLILVYVGRYDQVPLVARDEGAAGRAVALRVLTSDDFGLFERAAFSTRSGVRFEGMRRLAFGPKTPARSAALDRLANSPRPEVRASLIRALDEDPGRVLDAEYERASSLGAVGARRYFVRRVQGALYDPARLLGAATILARLANDPAPSVADAALQGLYLFLTDRLGDFAYTNEGPLEERPEDVPLDRLPPATRELLRRGAARRLAGPHGFVAAVVLARLHDPRAFPVLAPRALGAWTPERPFAVLALGVSGDRRAGAVLLELAGRISEDNAPFEALAHLRDPATIEPLLDFVRKGPVQHGLTAAYVLAAFGGERAARGMLAVARDARFGSAATNLYIPLGRLGGPEVARFLLERLEHGPEGELPFVALALGDMREPDVSGELRRIAALGGVRGERANEALRDRAYHRARGR